MTTCKLETCEIMVKETNIDTLLCYYNALVKKLNASSSRADFQCVSALAAQINAALQENISNLSTPTQGKVDPTDITNEFNKLLNTTQEEDAEIIKSMHQSTVMMWVIICVILVGIYILI